LDNIASDQYIHVLIVDDNFKVSMSLKTALVWTDKITSDRVFLLSDAIEKTKAKRPDVILLNMNLADSKGIDTFIELKNIDNTIPIILLSDGHDEELIIEAMMKGAQHYVLPSQINTETLRMALTYTITRMRLETQLRKEHAEARQAQARLTSVLQCIEEGICQVDTENKLTYINPEAERILGWRMEEVLGERLHDKFHYLFPDGTPRPAETCDLVRAFQEGKPYRDDDDYFVRKDGSFVWIQYSSAPLVLEGKTIGGVICFQDITERRQLTEQSQKRYAEAKDSQARLEATLDCLRDGICQIDTQNRITYANPAALDMLGYNLEELLGRMLHDTLHYKFPNGAFRPTETCALWQAFRDGRSHQADDDYMVCKDGKLLWIDCTSAPIKLDGVTVGGVLCFRDNSKSKARARQLDEIIKQAQDLGEGSTDKLRELINRIANSVS
jgi:PAS domain S-box-containing protein